MFINEDKSQRHFETEAQANAHVRELLSPWFDLLAEVHVRHPSKPKPLRIDYLIRPKVGLFDRPFGRPFVGVEIKRGYEQYRDFSSAIRQCHDYTHSTIEDKRVSVFAGHLIPLVFLFPPISDCNAGYREWEKGSIRTAGPLNVGVVFESLNRNGETMVTLSLCGNTWWDSINGPWGGSDTWNSKPKAGSR